MSAINRLKTAVWFSRRPRYWAHAWELTLRKIRADHDGDAENAAATTWAAEHVSPVVQALRKIGLASETTAIPQLKGALLQEGATLAKRSVVRMGGPGDIRLLYATVALSGARRVVETGVAYGWSSLAILAALRDGEGGTLVSVDMPYPKLDNEAFVGVAVPARLRSGWEILREPDRNGLKKAIARLGGAIDLCHYDSDKSWWGRRYGYALLWDALVPGGVFISDDISDNMAFAEFVTQRGLVFAVTELEGKYVGITRKK